MAYSIKLEQFEGPLDLLLHLVDKQKVAVEDIFVSRITEQYLAYMDGISMDMDNASGFLSMAATLLYIKSRALLPAPPRQTLDETEEDPREALIRRLNEYRAYKQLCETLRVQERAAMGRYYKLPEETFAGRKDLELAGVGADALFNAFFAVLQRKKPQKPEIVVREIQKEEITVAQCMRFIIAKLAGKNRVPFETLFSDDASRDQVIITFMALLELMCENTVTAEQEGHNTTIFITENTKRRTEA